MIEKVDFNVQFFLVSLQQNRTPGAPSNAFCSFLETTLLQFQSLIVSSRNDQQLASALEKKLKLNSSFVEGALRRAIVSRKLDLLTHALEVNRLIPQDSSFKVNEDFLLQLIHRTVSLREIELLRSLLSYISSPLTVETRRELQNIAILAAQCDFLEAARLLCLEFPSCVEQTFQGHSLLVAIAMQRTDPSIQFMSYLLEKGVDVNTQEPSGDTALHVAARENNMDAITLLMEYNSCVHLQNSQGLTPLDLAEDQARSLLKTHLSPRPCEISLYIAAKESNLGCVQHLLNSGVSVNSKWVNGHTALCAAAINGDFELTNFLLARRAAIFPPGSTWPELPVVHALVSNHADIAYLLIEKMESEYDRMTKKERRHVHQQLVSLLHYCARINAVAIATLILRSKFDIDLNNSFVSGLSPLHEACRCGHLDIVKLLLLYGVEANLQSNFYLNTPLHYASFYGHTHIAAHLLKYPEVDIDVENKQHEAPLYCVLRGQLTAEEKGQSRESSIIFLLMHGAKLLKPGRKNCELSQFDLLYAQQRWDFIPLQTQKLIIAVRNEWRPHSLMNAARFMIRASLSVPVTDDVLDKIGLPYRMRNYVLLKDWFPND